MKNQKDYIFISYSSLDSDRIRSEIRHLQNYGYETWFFEDGIPPGKPWPKVTSEALENTALFLVFITKNSVNSEQVNNEILFALDKQVPFVAVHLDKVELPSDLRLQIGRRQAILKYQLSQAVYRYKLQRILTPSNPERDYEPAPPPVEPGLITKAMQWMRNLKPTTPASGRLKSTLALSVIIPTLVYFLIQFLPNSGGSLDLRSSPKELAKQDIAKIVQKKGFFCNTQEYWGNQSGQGIDNLFELDANSEVVYDARTGLYWEKDGSGNRLLFNETKDHINRLNRRKLAGSTHWRLPTLDELMSLVEPKQNSNGLYIHGDFGAEQSSVWTSDTFKQKRWCVDFQVGNCKEELADYQNRQYVRAVSSGR